MSGNEISGLKRTSNKEDDRSNKKRRILGLMKVFVSKYEEYNVNFVIFSNFFLLDSNSFDFMLQAAFIILSNLFMPGSSSSSLFSSGGGESGIFKLATFEKVFKAADAYYSGFLSSFINSVYFFIKLF